MIRTQVQLTEQQVARLKKLASTRGVSVASEIRVAVEKHLDTTSAMPKKSRSEVLAGIKGFSSGLTTISQDHDLYLAEAFDE